MKTKYKYIEFMQSNSNDKVWHCGNHKTNDYLGSVEFVKKWQCYEFVPRMNTGYTRECLSDLAEFVQQLDDEHKQKPKPRPPIAPQNRLV